MVEEACDLDAESGLAPVSSLSIVSAHLSSVSQNIPPHTFQCIHHLRTGWCCRSVGESTVGWGGSASAPSQAFAWCGTTCETVQTVSEASKRISSREFVRTGIVKISRCRLL